MKTKALSLLYLAAFLTVCSCVAFGCGAKQLHTAVVADQTLFTLLSSVHAGEQTVLCGQSSCANVTARPSGAAWTDAKSQAFNVKFLPAVEAGRQYNLVLSKIKPGNPLPQEATDLINGLADSLKAIADDYPDGSSKSKILAEIGQAQSIVLKAVAVILTIKGA